MHEKRVAVTGTTGMVGEYALRMGLVNPILENKGIRFMEGP
jgi:hypothetical protein